MTAASRMTSRLPASLAAAAAQAAADWERTRKIDRLWARDASLWTGGDEGRWLDWLDAVAVSQREATALDRFADGVRAAGFRDAVLLGMGGSSLAPEVMAMALGAAPGHPRLTVLDSLDPAAVAAVEQSVDPRSALFIVSSKSGTTLETDLLGRHFFGRLAAALGAREAAQRFVAVTDPGSALERRARDDGYRAVFPGAPAIGGRYSALSPFGLVPAAVLGLDRARLLARAAEAAAGCRAPSADANPGLALGTVLGTAARTGRDKLTLVASPQIACFGAWIEQLVAESTGKNGTGIIPVDDEPPLPVAAYGPDRLFVYLRLAPAPDAAQDARLDALAHAGQPVITIELGDAYDLGFEFFRWEIATAVAGAILGVHPFDQPDVEAAKVAARQFAAPGGRAQLPALAVAGELSLYADPRHAASLGKVTDAETLLAAHLRGLRGGDYFALLAYCRPLPPQLRQFAAVRAAVACKFSVPACLGIGPRYLHSSGQLHKGGPNTGVFLELTYDAVPGGAQAGSASASFGNVLLAQAQGDFAALADRDRRVVRVHLGNDPAAGLARLCAIIERVCA